MQSLDLFWPIHTASEPQVGRFLVGSVSTSTKSWTLRGSGNTSQLSSGSLFPLFLVAFFH